MNLLARIDPSLLFLLGCALMTAILLRRSYRYFGGRLRKRSEAGLEKVHRPASAWDGMQRDASARIDRQQVELYDVAREVKGEIDGKLILLQTLIAKSQQQIDRMETLLAELECAEPAATARG